jgi:hypothetical protein
MLIIEKASNKKFLKDSKHEPFKVPVPKRMRLPSPGRYDELMEEGEAQQQDLTGLTGLCGAIPSSYESSYLLS